MKYPDRYQPRFSLSKLAEYAVASAARRRMLLQDQRYPPPYKAATYSEAYSTIADALVRGDPTVLDGRIEEWSLRIPTSPFHATSYRLWCESAAAFKRLLTGDAFGGLTFEGGSREEYVDIGGVKVSVRPDAIVTAPAGGALKIYLSRGVPLTADDGARLGSASYAAALLHQWVGTWLGDASTKSCLLVDVFAGKVHRAPTHFLRRRKDLAASCDEIAKLWPSIETAARRGVLSLAVLARELVDRSAGPDRRVERRASDQARDSDGCTKPCMNAPGFAA